MANKHVVFWGIAGSIILLDRITKWLVLSFIPLHGSIDMGFFSFVHYINTGTAFGLFKSIPWVFAAFAVLVSLFIIAKYKAFSPKMIPIAALVLGGAVGNLIDRILYGAVIDFIDFRFWPAFNVADSAITIAIFLLVVQELRSKRNI